MLLLHVVSAIVGTMASLWYGWLLYSRSETNPTRLSTLLRLIVLVGLVIVSLSGLGLFLRAPEVWLDAPRFTSNMTVLLILILSECVHRLTKNPRIIEATQALSMYSWSWIFVVALLDPQYPYIYIMLLYSALALSIIVYLMHRQRRTLEHRSNYQHLGHTE